MKVHITFKQKGDHNWSLRYAVNGDVAEIREKPESYFILEGKTISGEDFKYEIKNMNVFEFIKTDGGIETYAMSTNIIEKTQAPHNKRYNIKRYYFYLKNDSNWIRPIEGIYIAKEDFPKELLG